MGRYAKAPSSGDYPQPSPGTHLGICFRLIDLGTQHTEYQGEEKLANQLLVSWELPLEKDPNESPFTVSAFYTNSLHEKARLRRDLVSWRGRDFTDPELLGFDLTTILGKPCLVSVVHSQAGRAKVNAVLAVPRGSVIPPLQNEIVSFFIEEWDQRVFDQLPKGLRAIIERSEEYRARTSGATIPAEDEPSGPDMSDVPF